MILISHRGNISGPNSKLENKPAYILEALNKKYQVEVDVWYDNRWWLGHDEPQYKVEENFIFLTPSLWVHCKNAEALMACSMSKINGLISPTFFWHETDTYALVSNGLLWTYPCKPLVELSICVMPERGNYTKKQLKKCFGICSDHIEDYKNL